ncbi:MAG: TolC family protein [Tissierellia bacterium]|nr:TolC family protein [Tissierellia bacterium]
MKRLAYIIMVVLFATLCTPLEVSAQATSTGNGNPLSIVEAIEIAWDKNPALRKAKLEVDRAQIARDKSLEAVTWIPTGGLVVPAYQQVFNTYQQAEIGLTAAKKTEKLEKNRIAKEVIKAYTNALNDYKSMQLAYATYKNIQERASINSLANSIGLSSAYDYEQFKLTKNKAEQDYLAAESAYRSSIAELRQILNKSNEWQPQLISEPVITTYDREDLSTELARSMSESVLVWSKEALLDIEKSKQNWVIPNLPSDLQKIDLDMAEIDYEQAKQDARVIIEGLYHTIDLLEGQIESAEVNLKIAEKELALANLRYELGMIAKNGITGEQDLSSAQLKAQAAEVQLIKLKSQLAQAKAEFAYLTSKEVFNEQDWKQ